MSSERAKLSDWAISDWAIPDVTDVSGDISGDILDDISGDRFADDGFGLVPYEVFEAYDGAGPEPLISGLLTDVPRLDNQPPTLDGLMFIATNPAPCPYVSGRVEQKLVTMLDAQNARNFDTLNQAGFRRSHAVAYRPCCPDCNACTAIRIKALAFEPARSQRKLLKRGSHFIRRYARAAATEEHFQLFADYVNGRHGDGDMATMGRLDFAEMVEETAISTGLMEWRDPETAALVAACIVDVVGDGLSMVYSYFDEAHAVRGLGTFMILDCLALCRSHSLPNLYLGYWIKDAPKMDYKSRFHPAEQFVDGVWSPVPRPVINEVEGA